MKIEQGKQYNDYTILSDVTKDRIEVQCKCGTLKTVSRDSLRFKQAKNCGKGMCSSNSKSKVGKVYGDLVVLEDYLPNRRVRVKCKCGKIVLKDKEQLTAGVTKTCGLELCKARVKNLTGKIFGHLTAQQLVKIQGRPHSYWNCLCVCGNQKTVRANILLKGTTTSCGCKQYSERPKFKTLDEVGSTHVFGQYKRQAKSRGLSFDLTFEEFLPFLKKNCYYCGIGPSNKWNPNRANEKELYHYTGVDRKDSKFGYSLENCVPCCGKCNTVKNRSHHDDFLERVKLISSHLSLS